MTSAKIMLAVGVTAALLVATSANAQLHLPGVLGGNAAASSDTGQSDPVVAQDALVKSFVGSQIEVLTAQSFLAQAYGLKQSADELDAQQRALKSGAVDTDTLKKSIDISDKANEAITARQNGQSSLTAEEKAYYTQSLPHFAKGVIGTHEVISQAVKFTSAAKSSMTGLAGLANGLTKLKAGAFVAKSAPSYAKNLFDVFRKTMLISQNNGVKAPGDATDALGAL